MEAKIEKISELSKLLSVKTRMSDDLFHLFGKFGIGHLLSRLSLEKHDGVSASELLLSLCLFRIVGESIHSICKHKLLCLQRLTHWDKSDAALRRLRASGRMANHRGVFHSLQGKSWYDNNWIVYL